MQDVIVIGGGVIGLAIARELAVRKSVLLVDRGSTGQGTSRAAAGMLSPLSEADDQGPFFQLSWASHTMYDDFVRDLEDETKLECAYSRDGLLNLAATEEAAEALRCRYEWQKKAGFDIELLSGDAVRKLEPLITAPVAAAVLIPGDRSVAPRRLLNALRESCVGRGVEMRPGVHVEEVGPNAVRVGDLTLEAAHIVIASGVWSAEFRGLNPAIPVYPRKGQILSLGMPAGAFRHMIRWGSSYFVPRPTGEVIVGATNEDSGFDMSNTPAGLGRLLNEAQQISSHAGQYPILETWSGLRPATPDGLPILGPSAVPGVWYATGHYRNGILLAPITALILRELVESGTTGHSIEPYSPLRFNTSRPSD
jgi:glycine oxidase